MDRQSSLIGRTFGTCTLHHLLGEGGMGAVFLAEQARPSRTVAVKILLPAIMANTQVSHEFLLRFRREADVIARLEHINIIPIFEYGEEAGLAYLVMPYVSGGSLRDLLARKGRLSLQEAGIVLQQAALALDYAHAHQVVHRDLKPANLLLHADGRLMLADFGIARMIQSGDQHPPTLTGHGVLIGTPEYMSPEMFQGEPADHRSDIYALGIMLYQMLSGDVPFPGNTFYAVAQKHMHDAPSLLHQRDPGIPSTIDEVISTALAKKREERFASAGALDQAFRMASSSSQDNAPTALSSRSVPTILSSATPTRITPVAATQPVREPPTPVNHFPVTPFAQYPQEQTPYPPQSSRQGPQPWLIFLSMLMVLLLIVGGVLVGLLLNKGGPAPTPQSLTPATSDIPTQPITTPSHSTSGLQLGALLYAASQPGTCDSGNGQWINFNQIAITCLPNGTELKNTQNIAYLAGTFLTTISGQNFSSNYIIQVQLVSRTSADYGIYFRNQPGNAQGVYAFLLHANGTWSSYVYDNSTGAATELTNGLLGNVSGVLTIDVSVVNAHFTFYINGQYVGQANDSTYSTGTPGIAVDQGGDVIASNFALYQPASH